MFQGRDAETDALLGLWGRVLEGLSVKPESLVGILDWVSKKHLLDEFCRREGLQWGDPWLESQDLEFHQIDPARGLGLAIADESGYWKPVRQEEAKREPPRDSRARARSRLMREIQGKPGSYYVDWAEVEVPNKKRAVLSDPFHS